MNRRQALHGFTYDTWKNGNKVTAAQKATADKVWRAFVNEEDPAKFWEKTLYYGAIQVTYVSRFIEPFARKKGSGAAQGNQSDQITVGLRLQLGAG